MEFVERVKRWKERRNTLMEGGKESGKRKVEERRVDYRRKNGGSRGWRKEKMKTVEERKVEGKGEGDISGGRKELRNEGRMR